MFSLSLSTLKNRRQTGASTVEFLMTFIVILGLLLVITQVGIMFVNATLVNHALAIASQEASARGGVDPRVKSEYLARLPKFLQTQCTQLYAPGGGCISSSAVSGGALTGGRECTAKGDVFNVTAQYSQDMSLLRAVGVPVNDKNMKRTFLVASQSLNRSDPTGAIC